MRRTPYVENNEKLATKYATQLRTQHQRKTAQIKLYHPQLDYLAKTSKNPNGQPDEANGNNRLSPMLKRPVTGKNNYIESGLLQANRPVDSKNYQRRRMAESQYKRQSATPTNMRYQMPVRARSTNKSELFVSTVKQSKGSLGDNATKIYRTSLKDKDHKINLSYFRNQISPMSSMHYKRQKAKTPRAFSNPRSSRDSKSNKADKKHIEFSLSKPLQTFEKKSQKVPKQQQDFFQYVLRYSYRTKKGFMPNNPAKPNQDSYIISPNINKKSWQHYFGICDGHGVFGHFVSAYIKNQLPSSINHVRNLQKNPKDGLSKAFHATMKKLILESKIDLTFSGSTVVGCYLLQDKLYCCNVGDSRAIIGSYDDKTKKWSAKTLSNDHKPTVKDQADRIAKCGGRVQSFKDPQGHTEIIQVTQSALYECGLKSKMCRASL